MTLPVAIVLGARVQPDGTATPTLRRRAETAVALYRAGKVGRVIATGAGSDPPPSEAAVVAALLNNHGVPRDAITLEDRSRNTMENIAFAAALLPPEARVILVTDAWHQPRARLVARRLGLAATSASPSLRGANPWRTAKLIMREIAAFAAYLLRPMGR